MSIDFKFNSVVTEYQVCEFIIRHYTGLKDEYIQTQAFKNYASWNRALFLF